MFLRGVYIEYNIYIQLSLSFLICKTDFVPFIQLSDVYLPGLGSIPFFQFQFTAIPFIHLQFNCNLISFNSSSVSFNSILFQFQFYL